MDIRIIDEITENGYNLDVMRAVLKDKIEHTFNINDIAVVAKQLFGYDNSIVQWSDDEGAGVAYKKECDKIQEYLAYMAKRDLI